MLREISYLEDLDIVQLRTSGTYELSSEVDTLRKLATALKKHQCRKILADHRLANVIAETFETYGRPTLYEEIWGDESTISQIRTAVVFNEITDDYRFYETVLQNRGWNLNIFDDYEHALTWLIQ